MNSTIEKQLNHKTIRKFKDKPISKTIIETLVDVAQHTSTSNFMQSYSIISITDPGLKQAIAKIGNQPYIAETAHLFIFVIDQHRNASIAQHHGVEDISVLSTFDRFMVGYSDALLAAQNVMNALESLDLGGVFLGSILNHADKMIQLLNLPDYVFPVLGLGFGYPDQEPQLKPRLPQELMHFENSYPKDVDYTLLLPKYDAIVTEYYDLRDANKRIDSFSKQISDGMSRRHPGRMQLKQILESQKLGLK